MNTHTHIHTHTHTHTQTHCCAASIQPKNTTRVLHFCFLFDLLPLLFCATDLRWIIGCISLLLLPLSTVTLIPELVTPPPAPLPPPSSVNWTSLSLSLSILLAHAHTHTHALCRFFSVFYPLSWLVSPYGLSLSLSLSLFLSLSSLSRAFAFALSQSLALSLALTVSLLLASSLARAHTHASTRVRALSLSRVRLLHVPWSYKHTCKTTLECMCTYTHKHTHVCLYARLFVRVYMYVHTYMHLLSPSLCTYIYKYMLAHMHWRSATVKRGCRYARDIRLLRISEYYVHIYTPTRCRYARDIRLLRISIFAFPVTRISRAYLHPRDIRVLRRFNGGVSVRASVSYVYLCVCLCVSACVYGGLESRPQKRSTHICIYPHVSTFGVCSDLVCTRDWHISNHLWVVPVFRRRAIIGSYINVGIIVRLWIMIGPYIYICTCRKDVGQWFVPCIYLCFYMQKTCRAEESFPGRRQKNTWTTYKSFQISTRLDYTRKHGEWTGGRRKRIYHSNSLHSTRITHSNIMYRPGEMRKRTKEWKKHAELMWHSKEIYTCVSIWKIKVQMKRWKHENEGSPKKQRKFGGVGWCDEWASSWVSGLASSLLPLNTWCPGKEFVSRVWMTWHTSWWCDGWACVCVCVFVGVWAGSSLLPRNTWCLGGCVTRRSVCVRASSWVSGQTRFQYWPIIQGGKDS